MRQLIDTEGGPSVSDAREYMTCSRLSIDAKVLIRNANPVIAPMATSCMLHVRNRVFSGKSQVERDAFLEPADPNFGVILKPKFSVRRPAVHPAGLRRCMTKARKHQRTDSRRYAKSIYDEVRYLTRTRGRDPHPVQAFSRHGPVMSGDLEMLMHKGDHHYRIIISPEPRDSMLLVDPEDFIRSVMAVYEKQLGRRLQWASVVHDDKIYDGQSRRDFHVLVSSEDDEGRHFRLSPYDQRDRVNEIARDELTRRLGRQRTRGQSRWNFSDV